MANITTALNLEEVLCSAEFREEIHDHLMWLIVFTILLSFTAILENTLILVVLHKDSSLHPPSKLLIFSIVSTDLFAGIVREPLAVVVWTSMISERWNICRQFSFPFQVAPFFRSGLGLRLLLYMLNYFLSIQQIRGSLLVSV